MLIELRTKSQITLPKDIINTLGLAKGDKLEIYEQDGMICIVPVTVYPKKYVDEIHNELSQLRDNIKSGKQPVFDSIDKLIDKLQEN